MRLQSENWGGIMGTIGNLIVIAAGDAQGYVSTTLFMLASYAVTHKGHTSWGYSLASLGFCIGDVLLCFSDATSGNLTLQIMMALMAFAWGIGAMRYPVERMGYHALARHIPLLVAGINLVLRVPALYSAAFSGDHFNTVMFICNIFWGICDVLLGRVHSVFQRFSRISSLRFKSSK